MDTLRLAKLHCDTKQALGTFAIGTREEHLFLKGTSIDTARLHARTKSVDPISTHYHRRCGHAEAISSSSASPEIFRRFGRGKLNKVVQAASEPAPTTDKSNSILCQNCEGNGAVVCSQCKGGGLNSEDHFGGRFKAGTICWLCRGKKQTLCGNCNGAGFMGGFLNTQDD